MPLSREEMRRSYSQLLEGTGTVSMDAESSVPTDLEQDLLSTLKALSGALYKIRNRALNSNDVRTAQSAGEAQLRVDFIILHLNEELLSELDNSADLARARSTISQANTDLGKVADATQTLAKRLDRAKAILGTFERLIGLVR